jgi:hypothetical protein
MVAPNAIVGYVWIQDAAKSAQALRFIIHKPNAEGCASALRSHDGGVHRKGSRKRADAFKRSHPKLIISAIDKHAVSREKGIWINKSEIRSSIPRVYSCLGCGKNRCARWSVHLPNVGVKRAVCCEIVAKQSLLGPCLRRKSKK